MRAGGGVAAAAFVLGLFGLRAVGGLRGGGVAAWGAFGDGISAFCRGRTTQVLGEV